MNNRRKLIVVLGAGVLGTPFRSFAQQQGKVWRIGWLRESENPRLAQNVDAFRFGMRELGYVEGQNYVIEMRSVHSDLARLPAVVSELLATTIDLIISGGTPSAVAARNATREIPILIVTAGDPVGSGFAATLSRPGGNITGLTNLASELYTKRLDLLCQTLPRMRHVGFLYDPNNRGNEQALKQFESNCAKLKLIPVIVPLPNPEGIGSAFDILKRRTAQGMIVSGSSVNNAMQQIIVNEAAKQRLPAIYSVSSYAEAGGLLSYAPDYLDLHRRAATYADKIFKGAKAGDLPIEQPTKFEMVVNMKTAKELGIKIPNSILVQATKVIE